MRSVLVILMLLLSPLAYADGLFDRLSSVGASKQPTFLPPDQAFQVTLANRDAHTLLASFNITPGYYLYRDRISFKSLDQQAKLEQPLFPHGEMKQDPNFGMIEVFHHSFQVSVGVQSTKPAQPYSVVVEYQGCSENGLCYPPIEKTIVIDPTATAAPVMSAAPQVAAPATSDNSKIAQLFKSGNFWLIITFFFGAGLLLAFTPCVFPMIPILSGIIVGRGHHITKMHAFILSLSYVLGMAVTYAAAGVAAGFSGELISNAMQTPWVLGSFAAVFVLLSLSMFGFYELQLPTALQSKLADTSNRLHGGHLSGVFLMGALSAVIMGPCVAAPLAGALLYISQTHDALLGGVALFMLALGMGAPLLLIGTSAGVLLPKAGAWMDAVKRFFGVMLLGLAIWIIQPLLPIGAQMMLWALLLILSAAYLRVLDALPKYASGWLKLRKGLGLLMLLLGVAYLIGALSGARDILKPLGSFSKVDAVAGSSVEWTRVKDLNDFKTRLASAQGKIVVLDFYADWCVSCKEMERYTFSDAAVKAKLANAILLQADVTANSEADKNLLKEYGLFGPPATLFFNAEGTEVQDGRVVGYQEAQRFLISLQNVGL